MATLLLGAIGGAIGSSVGGSILGIGAAAIGKAVGSAVGRWVDQSAIAILAPNEQNYGPEVGRVGFALPREGEMLARGLGWQKLPARICWPENLHFAEESETVTSGGKGAQNKTSTTTYSASVTIAVAIHDGEIDMIGRVWADGNLITLADICSTVTLYKGTATQDPDPTLEAEDGAGNVPDWRGVAYLVLEGFNLSTFGNRIPQLEFEVFKAAASGAAFTGVSLAPTAGEFGLDPAMTTERIVETVQEAGGTEEVVIDESPVNNNAVTDAADIITALDMLKLLHPQVQHVVVEYPWFGDDLRASSCEIKPRVEVASRETAPSLWTVQGIARGAATIVSQIDGAGAYGGTPSDSSVTGLIVELRARGYSTTFSPLVLMDIPAGNGLSDPYGGVEQSAYPDRSQITCDPAIGQAGTVDKTAAATTQMAAFFGAAVATDYTVTGQTISYSGPADWGYNRFVLHCAALVKAAGGLGSFLIGSGLSGLTKVRADATTFPAVGKLETLIGEVRTALLGVEAGIPATILKAAAPVDGVAVPYRPLGEAAANEAWHGSTTTYQTYGRLADFTEGGQVFTVGADGYLLEHAAGTWQYIFVDIPFPSGDEWSVDVSFEHAKSPATVSGLRRWYAYELKSGTGLVGPEITAGKVVANYPTSGSQPWAVESYSGVARGGGDHVRFEYYMGQASFLFKELTVTFNELIKLGYAANLDEYGAYAPADGTGDVLFPLDPLWANIDCGYLGINYTPPLADARDGDAGSIYDLPTLKANIEGGEYYDWTYESEADRQSKTRTAIADATYGEPWIFRQKDLANWWANAHHPRPLGVRSVSASPWVASSKPMRLYYSCPAIDRAANQPDVEVNPNSGAYALPHFSNGARDDESQSTYLLAVAEFWAADLRGVVDAAASAALGWDARPWPVYPHTDLWPDAAAWPTGRSFSGRNQVSVAAWLQHELDYRGLSYSLDQITGGFDGITVSNLAGFMAVAAPILSAFQLDATEVAGEIAITSRALQAPQATIDLGAVIPLSEVDRYRAPRGNAGALPALAWLSHKDIGHEYDANTVPSRLNRAGKSESFLDLPVLIDPQKARDFLRVMHVDSEIALDTLECELPPSWLNKLVPGRTMIADAGLGPQEWLIQNRSIGTGVRIKARRLDREALRPNPVPRTGNKMPSTTTAGSTALAMPDLPWMKSSDPAHDLRAAIFVNPAQGLALQRSLDATTGYTAVGQYAERATMGVLTADLPAGTRHIWDRATTLSLRLYAGTLVSKSDAEVRGGANWLAVRTDAAANIWEIVGFRDAALTGNGAYDLTTLLRGLRGSQIAVNIAAGALVVVLDGLPFAGLEIDNLGTSYYWSAGPSAKPRTDPSWVTRQVAVNGAGLKPFAPTRLRGALNGAGDLTLTWMRQDRDPRAEKFGRATTPMSEESLLFIVVIGAQSWSVTAETATILAADLPPLPFAVTVQQVSADVGAGHPLTLTME